MKIYRMALAKSTAIESERIDQIENWFHNEDWELSEEEIQKKENSPPESFFGKHVATLWTHFTILEIIDVARAYKSAAYTAYEFNEGGFRDFCNMAWGPRKKMDLSQIPALTAGDLTKLFNLFDINEIIFPANVPEDILNRLPNAQVLTFNLNRDKPYSMPKYASIRNARLTINGDFCMNMADPLAQILFTFPRINHLTIHNVFFTRISIAALSTCQIKNITITQSSLYPNKDSAFVDALLNSRGSLESITIDCNNNYTWESTIRIINSRVRSFSKLRSYRLTMGLGWRNATAIKNLGASKTLRNIHFITHTYQNTEKKKMMDMIRRGLKKSKIGITFEERSLQNVTTTVLDDWE